METLTFNYLTRFHCIGPQCEDPCCIDWDIDLYPEDRNRLRHALEATPETRAEYHSKVKSRAPSSQEPRGFIQRDGANRCAFLTAAGWCSIQSRFGAETLPKICATFPRVIQMLGARLEMTGNLSCPELARLCLLADDSTQLVRIPPELLPNMDNRLIKRADLDAGQPYKSQVNTIRELFFTLLGLPESPWELRMLLFAFFANRTRSFFHAAQREEVTQSLLGEVTAIVHPNLRAKLAVVLRQVKVNPVVVFNIIKTIIDSRLEFKRDDPFHQLVTEVTRAEGREIVWDPTALLHRYTTAKEHWNQRFAAKIERWFTNYCVNYCLKQLYTGHSDLLCYVEELLIHAATLRFLLFGLLGVPEDDPTPEESLNRLERAMVRVVQQHSKAIEHSDLGATLHGWLRYREADSLAHMVLLIRF